MIVSTLIKFLFFYLIFIFIRNFLRGASKINQVKQQMKAHMDQMNGQEGFRQQPPSYSEHSHNSKKQSKSGGDDIVDAEFRHL